jgi:hypothetical protein
MKGQIPTVTATTICAEMFRSASSRGWWIDQDIGIRIQPDAAVRPGLLLDRDIDNDHVC